jgi:hypothetical protein
VVQKKLCSLAFKKLLDAASSKFIFTRRTLLSRAEAVKNALFSKETPDFHNKFWASIDQTLHINLIKIHYLRAGSATFYQIVQAKI